MTGPELSGNKVRLRTVRDDDLVRRVSWLNDPETARLFTGTVPLRVYMLTDAERWRQSTEADAKTVVWSIDAIDGTHIGDIDLHSIDDRIHSAKLTILIGDKSYWNSGYGTDVIRTVLSYAFGDLRLDNVYLRVFDFNNRAIRCYEKCGFVAIGTVASSSLAAPRANEIHMMINRNDYIPENLYADTFQARPR